MTAAIQTRALSRLFPGGHGVHDLALSVPAGSIYGFLGPNGAGKTTTIRLLLGLLQPQAGEVALFGHDLRTQRAKALAQVGALVESPALYGHLTGRDNLEVTRRLLALPRPRIDTVLERVGLLNDGHRRVREYSLGMRQRLAIAQAMLSSPRLLVLDEPGNGLDPAGILDMRHLLRGLAAEGITVFVSSHQLGEVEQVATHVGVLRAGLRSTAGWRSCAGGCVPGCCCAAATTCARAPCWFRMAKAWPGRTRTPWCWAWKARRPRRSTTSWSGTASTCSTWRSSMLRWNRCSSI